MTAKAENKIKPYTSFVIEVFNCIAEDVGKYGNSLNVFAEGRKKENYSGSQEYAVLRNAEARLFHSVLCDHADVFGLDMAGRPIKVSKIYEDETKITHSCYPKNVRRWLNGTISRKKICRIDFCVLAWCHAAGWNPSFDLERIESYNSCQKKLVEICNGYLGTQERILSIDLLWKASMEAYLQSFC